MRWLVLVVCRAASLLLLYLGGTRLAGAILRSPGFQAVELAATGNDIRPESYERAVRSLEGSLRWHEHRRSYAELGIIHHNIGRQSGSDVERARLYDASLEAIRTSLRFSQVQPMAWLLMARSSSSGRPSTRRPRR
jgi:hypothetical protein